VTINFFSKPFKLKMKILKKYIPFFAIALLAIIAERPSAHATYSTVFAILLFVFTTYSVFFGNGKGPWDE
jgi:hypothetical protein